MTHNGVIMRRVTFIAGAATAIVAAPQAAQAVAQAETLPAALAPTLKAETWWSLYLKWDPRMARFPGSYLGAILRDAEAGSPSSIEWLKQNGMWPTIQSLLATRERGEPIYPRSAGYRRPPLTPEQLARATKIPPAYKS
jgi:hypothetical protein